MAEDSSIQRFKKSFLCPICGGYDDHRLGQARCYGYQLGAYANCTVTPNGSEKRNDGTWGHFLEGPCRCGTDHQTGQPAAQRPRRTKDDKHKLWLYEVLAKQTPWQADDEIERVYLYKDAAGFNVLAVTRHKPKSFRQWGYDDARKDFFSGLDTGKIDGDGDPIKVQPVLYNLPALAHAAPGEKVYITEGEKDAETLMLWGLLATTAPMGAGKWEPHYTRAIAGHPVVICADNDERGVKHAERLTKELSDVCPSVETVYIPKVIGKDVSDYATAGKTKEDFLRLVDSSWDDSVCMAEVQEEEMQWLWKGFLPLGCLVDVVGEGGIGKSTIFSGDIAARITRGWPMPDGWACEQGTVLLASAEESLSQILKPRLMAAGADDRYVRSIGLRSDKADSKKKRLLSLEHDIADMERLVKKYNVKLIFIDPIASYLGPKIDALKVQDVRRVLTPLADMAARTGVTIVYIRHHTKGGNANAVHIGGGATAFSDIARISLHVVKDPDDEDVRYLTVAKGNILPEDEKHSMTYKLVSSEARPKFGRVQWTGASKETAQDLNDRARAERGDGAAYIKVLREAGAALHYKDIAAELGRDDDKGINAVKMMLSRLVDKERIKAVGGGYYLLPARNLDAGHDVINLPDLLANFSGRQRQQERPAPMAASTAPHARVHVEPDVTGASAPTQQTMTPDAPVRPYAGLQHEARPVPPISLMKQNCHCGQPGAHPWDGGTYLCETHYQAARARDAAFSAKGDASADRKAAI